LVQGLIAYEKKILNKIAPDVMGARVCGEPAKIKFE
jgi:hypothetical protein